MADGDPVQCWSGLVRICDISADFATLQEMPLAQAGTLIAVFGITGMLSRIILTPLGNKFSDESHLLFALIAIAAGAIMLTMQAGPGSHGYLWAGAIGMGMSAVATNAIAMSMLIRDSAFGRVTETSGYVSLHSSRVCAGSTALWTAVQSNWQRIACVESVDRCVVPGLHHDIAVDRSAQASLACIGLSTKSR